LRGRTKPAAGGPVVETTFNASTDLSVAPVTSDTTTYFGDSLGTISSRNGDGVRDIVIGAFQHEDSPGSDNNAGMVFVVDGNAVGSKTVATPTDDPTNGIGIFQIGRSGFQAHWGAMVVNNSTAASPDVDDDGLEDLVIVGGTKATGGVFLYIWYGDDLPSSNTTSASAHHKVPAPAAFQGNLYAGRIGPLVASWVGDTNGDGLEDICWADHNASTDSGTTIDGVAEFLDDDGM
jgi:hypothetical protein